MPETAPVSLETPATDDTWMTADTLILAGIAIVCLLICWAVVRAVRRGVSLDYTDWRRYDPGPYSANDYRSDERGERRRRDGQEDQGSDGDGSDGDGEGDSES